MKPLPGHTFRCSTCNHNWPWYRPFAELCPVCEQPTTPIKDIPQDGILSLEEANLILRDYGIRVVPTRRRHAPSRREIETLYRDLETWVHAPPDWARR